MCDNKSSDLAEQFQGLKSGACGENSPAGTQNIYIHLDQKSREHLKLIVFNKIRSTFYL